MSALAAGATSLILALAAPGSRREASLQPDVVDVNYIGGCRAYAPRASYRSLDSGAGCTSLTACELCGEENCPVHSMPSGMTFPRHNVRQYMGNAPWDARSMGLGEAVAAMLGDPFAFAVSPELDVLRRLLQKPSLNASALASQAESAWYADERYNSFYAAEMTRNTFINALTEGGPRGQGLTRESVLSSETWARLSSPTIKEQLQKALISGRELSHEVSTCAAIYMMDSMFAVRQSADVLRDLQSEEPPMVQKSNLSIWETLYRGAPSAMVANAPDDPHNVVYTTVYPQIAHGFYGGNLTIAFVPADVNNLGSGVDVQWADEVGCPMPGRESQFCAQRANASFLAAQLAAQIETPDVADLRQTSDMPDVGELRTPNYKAPQEVDAAHVYQWNQEQSCVFPDANSPNRGAESGCDASFWEQHPTANFMRVPFDLSLLARPIEWSFERLNKDVNVHARMVLVLAPPVAAGGGVYGVDYDFTNERYTATPPPPFRMPDHVVADSVPVKAADLPPRTSRVVPVWGVLYACSATNLLGAYNRETPSATPDVCAAARALRPHRPHLEPLSSELTETTLPADLAQTLADVRVWPFDATVDLAGDHGLNGPTSRHRRQVCVLSFASATLLDRAATCAADL